jgi:hypothetical protein
MSTFNTSYAMASLAFLVACGGGGDNSETSAQPTQEFTLSGMVSGMSEGEQITLNNNANNATVISANGNFSFTGLLAYNAVYAVTVGTQPNGQNCIVSFGNGAGVIADVDNVRINCRSLPIDNV